VKVYGRIEDDDNLEIQEVLIDLRLRYLAGSQAEYLKEGSIRREAGRVVYDVRTSKTDLLSVQVGVAVRF
jgi:hypothetical protein